MSFGSNIGGAVGPACPSQSQSRTGSLIGWRLGSWSAVRCTYLSGGFGEACQASKSVGRPRSGLGRWHEGEEREGVEYRRWRRNSCCLRKNRVESVGEER